MNSIGSDNVMRVVFVVFVYLSIITLQACSTAWHQANQIDTIESYNIYLSQNPNTRMREEAESRLEQLYWENASPADDIASYERYTKNVAPRLQKQEARLRLEQLHWDNVSINDSIALLVGKLVGVLEVMQPGNDARGNRRCATFLREQCSPLPVEDLPVDQRCQAHQLVALVDQILQAVAEQLVLGRRFAASGSRFFVSICKQIDGILSVSCNFSTACAVNNSI